MSLTTLKPQQQDPNDRALELDHEGLTHLVGLLQIALRGIPESSGPSQPRAMLHAALDFIQGASVGPGMDTASAAPAAAESEPEGQSERLELALRASWQIDACVDGGIDLIATPARTTEAAECNMVTRALLLRIRELNGVVMNAIDDDAVGLAEMERCLTGLRRSAEEPAV